MTQFDPKTFLNNLTTRPGVYRMFDKQAQVLYVGKAKNLKNRVSSYFRCTALEAKTIALVTKIEHIEVTVTGSETEALLLEQSLIKAHKPPYNIDFKDDKSYPYIYLSSADTYPRLAFHRGAQRQKGRYFGPFPSAYSVRDSLNILQKVFKIRQCEDTFFQNRTRPCLQYQIKRCSAPCCGLVNPDEYTVDVNDAIAFLEGKSRDLINHYANNMEKASENLEFEQAAKFRDQIAHLHQIQEQQYVTRGGSNIDIITAVFNPGAVCVLVAIIRGGRMLGDKAYFPKVKMEANESELLASFIPQFYLSGFHGREIPQEIIVNAKIADKVLIAKTLSTQSGRKVSLADNVRGHRRHWVQLARTNAEQRLGSHLANKNTIYHRFETLQQALSLPVIPERLECFDISHTTGEAPVASCVVFDHNGPIKSDYRRFNISGITPGDDYAAISQALLRRYTRVKKGEGSLPDVLFIDGGKGQLKKAKQILEELQIADITLVGVAKGPSRKPGLESLLISGQPEIVLPADNPGLHLIQHIRDESHRFAIIGHRQKRDKKRKVSVLESIIGVGPQRRRALLRHFGGIARIEAASIADLIKVAGISQKLADHIYATLHQD